MSNNSIQSTIEKYDLFNRNKNLSFFKFLELFVLVRALFINRIIYSAYVDIYIEEFRVHMCWAHLWAYNKNNNSHFAFTFCFVAEQ